MIAIRVPATSANLGPGFDAFGVALDLHLEARLVPAGPQRVVSRGEGHDELPGGDDNLIWRSYLAFTEAAGGDAPDATIEVENAIPLQRGLGSSSAAIVAGLGLARAATGAVWSDLDLAGLAAELEGHPDNVVPAILGGLTVTAREDQGRLVVRRVNPHPALHPVVLVPDTRQSTDAARAVLPDTLPAAVAADQAARAGHVLGALAGVWPADPGLSGDHLHEPARLEAMGASGEVVGALREHDVHAWLSGAGPAVAAAPPQGSLGACSRVASEHGFALRRCRWDLSGLVTVRSAP